MGTIILLVSRSPVTLSLILLTSAFLVFKVDGFCDTICPKLGYTAYQGYRMLSEIKSKKMSIMNLCLSELPNLLQ